MMKYFRLNVTQHTTLNTPAKIHERYSDEICGIIISSSYLCLASIKVNYSRGYDNRLLRTCRSSNIYYENLTSFFKKSQ